MGAFDNSEIRRVLGHHPTGIGGVTALSGAGPVGILIGAVGGMSSTGGWRRTT